MVLQESDPLSLAPPCAAALSVAGLVLLSEKPRFALATALGLALAIVVWVLLWYVLSAHIGPFAIAWINGSSLPGRWMPVVINSSAAVAAWLLVAPPGALVARAAGLQRDRAVAFALIWFGGFVLPLIGHGGLQSPASHALFAVSALLAVAMAVALVGLRKDTS